jgi:putative PIN family toxin of toxin-antitoxin system
VIIVFDTNVILAAFLTHGASAEVVEHCITEHEVFISSFILDEVKDKLRHKFRFPPSKVADLLSYLRDQLELIEPAKLTLPTCRDPDDDMILATGVAARADCIVTGDNELLDLKQYQGIPIIKPAEFWRLEASFRN